MAENHAVRTIEEQQSVILNHDVSHPEVVVDKTGIVQFAEDRGEFFQQTGGGGVFQNVARCRWLLRFVVLFQEKRRGICGSARFFRKYGFGNESGIPGAPIKLIGRKGDEMKKLSLIEGIGETYTGKLEAEGIKSVDNLLEAGAGKKGRQALSEKTGISEKMILKWVNRADLFRIKGISTQYSDLLEIAGVDTVPELAQRKAENLQAKMVEVNEEKKLVKKVPTLADVESWIAQAKELPRVVTH